MNRLPGKQGFMQGGSGFAYLGSFLGLLAFVQAIIPRQSWYLIQSFLNRFLAWASIYTDFYVNEYEGNNSNEIYDMVEQHVATLASSNNHQSSPRRLNLSQLKNATKPIYGLADGESVVETFQGVSFWWMHRIMEQQQQSRSFWSRSDEKRYYKLTVHRRYRHTVLPAYLEYLAKHAKELKHQNRDKLLYTNTDENQGRGKPWRAVPFKHPATFESMALHPELKQKITEDLEAFMVAEAFHKRVGRAWKRGYLLYGPPGTGKSSLIAAIANFTGYDVYDLELTEVKSNAELRKLLMLITNKSIIVIEDIDCSLELEKRGKPAPDTDTDKKPEDEPGKKGKEQDEKSRVTLSGLLNFTDGLWSCCGSERIIIFTTNHREKLDAALLRSGRMDLHIHMSYCSFPAFKVLAWTHLGLREHDLFGEIEELMGSVQMTPADVAEVLIENKSNAEAALQSLIVALKGKPKTD